MSEKIVAYDLDALPPLTDGQKADLERLASTLEGPINTSDIPELTDEQWRSAVRGRFYKPRKATITTRLDSDVLTWLKSSGAGYQSSINSILRRVMLEARKSG